MAKRFPDGARVMFIGDSITAGGRYVAHIYDHYLRNFPNRGIKFYTYGVSGGSAKSALKYFDWHMDAFRPTHAVIMLGVNDIWRSHYHLPLDQADFEDKHVDKRIEALSEFKANIRELVDKLLSMNVELTLMSPVCVDESQSPHELDYVGCDAALELISEFYRRLALEKGLEYVNLHAAMRYYSTIRTMIRPDRVHPVELGHMVMANVFLAAQGLAEEIDPLAVNDLPEERPLTAQNAARYVIEQRDRMLWNCEWLLFSNHPELVAPEDRMAYVLEYHKNPDIAPFFASLCEFYEKYSAQHEEIVKELLAATDACGDHTEL